MRYLIIGGTGSLGNAFIDCLYKNEQNPNITVVSREELKQLNLKRKWPNIKMVIGDVRDKESIAEAVKNSDLVLNFSALKHVDICEENQAESYKVNLLGAMNVVDLCKKYGVNNFVFSSTDKAVLPINVYGFHKACAERYNFANGGVVFRWGNVIGSRGSVLHRFRETLEKENTVYITNLNMTRFWIHINEVAQFMYQNCLSRDKQIFIPDMKSSTIVDLARAVATVIGVKGYQTKVTGIRPGEKIHECLKSDHEEFGGCVRSDTARRFNFEELCGLVERAFA